MDYNNNNGTMWICYGIKAYAKLNARYTEHRRMHGSGQKMKNQQKLMRATMRINWIWMVFNAVSKGNIISQKCVDVIIKNNVKCIFQ